MCFMCGGFNNYCLGVFIVSCIGGGGFWMLGMVWCVGDGVLFVG